MMDLKEWNEKRTELEAQIENLKNQLEFYRKYYENSEARKKKSHHFDRDYLSYEDDERR